MAPRRSAAAGLDRPALPTPARALKRVTVDLPADQHRALRLWVVDAGVDARALMCALLALALEDPVLRADAEDRARG